MLLLLTALYALMWLQCIGLTINGDRLMRLILPMPVVLIPLALYLYYVENFLLSLGLSIASICVFNGTFNWVRILSSFLSFKKSENRSMEERLVALMLLLANITAISGCLLIFLANQESIQASFGY